MHILIIDDCPMTRLALRTMLESAGFTVSEAEDGEQIVKDPGRLQADLVLCDIFMPGRDGLEVIRELRRSAPDTKIIAISAGAFDGKVDMLQIALRLGANEILHKPIREDTLLATIGRASGKSSRELTDVGM